MIPSINRDWIKSQIDSVRDSIGRNVIFYTTSKSACPICVSANLYDAASDTSFNVICPQCKGAYWLLTAVANEILARVHWVNDEAITATPGGKYYIGDATVTVDEIYLDLIQACQSESGKVSVDGHDMQITRIIPFGAPAISRYRVVLRNMGDRP